MSDHSDDINQDSPDADRLAHSDSPSHHAKSLTIQGMDKCTRFDESKVIWRRDSSDMEYDHPTKHYSTTMNKRELKEMRNCIDRLIAPQTDLDGHTMAPVKRPSRFDCDSLECDPVGAANFDMTHGHHDKRSHAPTPVELKEKASVGLIDKLGHENYIENDLTDEYDEEEEVINNQEEAESDLTGDKIVGYDEATDSIILSSGKTIPNKNQISREYIDVLIKCSNSENLGKQKDLKDTLDSIYANQLTSEEIETKLFNENFFAFIKDVSLKKNPKNDNWKGMDFLLTEIVKKARENLASKKRYLCQRANKKENNNNFLNEIKGGRSNKTYVRETREPFSAIIVQTEENSIIQQFREAPSAYIFFVNELIQNFIEVTKSANSLDKIFTKLKDHFWGSPASSGKPQARMDVNIEIEHMALFFHDIMKDQAIYKIMKSAQQTLEDDKAILQEYRIFKDIIKAYKQIYSYCKQCYKIALIRNKFEDPKVREAGARSGNGCANKLCPHCNRTQLPQTTENPEKPVVLEEDKHNLARAKKNSRADPLEEEDDEEVEEEDEESSEDELEFDNQSQADVVSMLQEYQNMMTKRIEEEKRAEKIKKQINKLSVEEVVDMIENSNEAGNGRKQKAKKRKNKKKDKKNNITKNEEEISQKESNTENDDDQKGTRNSQSKRNSAANTSDDIYLEDSEHISQFHSKIPWTGDDEEAVVKSMDCNERDKPKLVPNLSMDWLRSLKKRLQV